MSKSGSGRFAGRRALAAVVAASAAPYGYTVSIWSSGAVLIRARGLPHVGDVFTFMAGAVVGFSLLALAARPALDGAESAADSKHRVAAGALHWVAIAAAVGAVALLAMINSWVAWPLGSCAATVIYIVGASLELRLVTALRG